MGRGVKEIHKEELLKRGVMAKEEDIIKRYKKRISKHIEEESIGDTASLEEFSREYVKFREEALSRRTTRYENWCNALEKIVQIKPSEKQLPLLRQAIETAHLNITPTGAATFAVVIGLIIIILGLFVGILVNIEYITSAINGTLTEEMVPNIFLAFAIMILGVIIFKPLTNFPIYLADRWRLKASNQMVLCILYIVMYMRHTPNLEHAIKFATEHIQPPLSLDLRKVFWDVEIGRYSTIKESLDNYLEMWRHYNLEFINSFHLVESSLYEPSEKRRLELLDKALDTILEGTYEKMMSYAHNLKNPITMLHMLGVILPILGLVIFPLVGSFLGGLVKWYHLAFLYNLMLPIIVFTVGLNILSKRPTGYGESEFLKPEKQKNLFYTSIFIALFFITIASLPLVLHRINPETDIHMGIFGNFFGYQDEYGPFGIGALIMSFFFPLGLAFAIGIYYKLKTKKSIELRNETKDLEKEFASSLFQLGTRIGDGIPSEVAFSNVARTMEGTPSGNFFRIVDVNIRNLGMGLKEAIFNRKTGAVLNYPSPLVTSSMEVLLESSKKGPQITAQALLSISTYVERIHHVNERLKDLLSEIISSMKSQISFLTPAIAGIVIGIASMIVNIIVQLGSKFQEFEATGEATEASGTLSLITQLFNVGDIIPSYFFQLVVGLYVLQITYILIILSNGIENGSDKLNEEYLLGKNLIKTTLIYTIIAIIVVILFNILSQGILSGTQF